MDETAPSDAVLIVEDEPLVRMVAADTLSDCGLKSFEAGDAAEALRMLNGHPEIGLVFTDINMPGEMDGLGLVDLVHRLWPKIQLIVTSGRYRLFDRDLPDDGSFLAKPYQQSQLVALVRQKLRLASAVA